MPRARRSGRWAASCAWRGKDEKGIHIDSIAREDEERLVRLVRERERRRPEDGEGPMSDKKEKKAKKDEGPARPRPRRAQVLATRSSRTRARAGRSGASRAWTAIVAFALVLVLSLRSGVPARRPPLRALIARARRQPRRLGLRVAVWRQLMLAELRWSPTSAASAARARRGRHRARAAERAAERASAAAAMRR